MRPIPTLDGQLRSQIKPGSCFACNKPGHWRAQCPLLTSKPRAGQWLAGREEGQDQGVVVSNVVANSLSNVLENDVLDSDHSSSVATLKSLTHCEFVSGQAKVCSVRGNLAKWYQEWVNIDAPGFILSVIRDGYKIPFIVFPPPKVSPNNGSALKEREFVSEAICKAENRLWKFRFLVLWTVVDGVISKWREKKHKQKAQKLIKNTQTKPQ